MAAKLTPAIFALACISIGIGFPLYADNLPTKRDEIKIASPLSLSSWAQLSDEQKRELLTAYQNIKPLNVEDQADLQQRLDWFSQLPQAQQQRMREVWQNMSPNERDYWKTQLKTASPQQREELRNKIMAKYN